MKKVVIVVACLFALLVVFSLLGFNPDASISGGAVYFPGQSFCATEYHKASNGLPERYSDCYQQILDNRKASYADVDMTKYYDNHFELKPGDKLIIDNTYVFKFIKGFVREWAEGSNNVPNYESQISVGRLSQLNSEGGIQVKTVKKRDELVAFDRLNMVMDWVTDVDEDSNVDDRAQFIFPTSVNINYNPILKLGDQVLVDGKVVEFVKYRADIGHTADVDKGGWVDLKIDGVLYSIYSFDKPANLVGLKISVDTMNPLTQEIGLMFNDVKTGELLE